MVCYRYTHIVVGTLYKGDKKDNDNDDDDDDNKEKMCILIDVITADKNIALKWTDMKLK